MGDVPRASWPGIDVPDDVFQAWLVERDATRLDAARRSELYFTCACARGDAAALKLFESQFMPLIELAASRYGERAFVEDVCQLVRQRLLMADGATPPRIGAYRGRGELGSFLRAVAVRTALNQLGAAGARSHAGSDEDLLDVPAPADDPELASMKVKYRDDFKRAFVDAMASLDDQTRTVLRLYYLDGVGLSELGRLYGFSVPTASRRLAAARAAVADATRQRMSERLSLTPQELESVLRLIDSHLSAGGGSEA